MPPADPRPLTTELLHEWALPLRKPDKEGRGTVLVVGAEVGTPGAVLLAGTAALRMGAGRLQVAVPAPIAGPLAVVLPEAKVVGLPVGPDDAFRPRRALERLHHEIAAADAVLVGPGMADRKATVRLVDRLFRVVAPAATVVVDAAALVALSQASRGSLDRVRDRLVLTPNLPELGRLAGRSDAGELARTALDVADRFGAAVTCHTVIVEPGGGAWSCTDGGPALGTSGSGDVLAGLIAGAAARGAAPAQAAVWGTFVHAQCGRRLGQRLGPLSVLAREIVDDATLVMAGLDTATT